MADGDLSPAPAAIVSCDAEPIHIPGAILPHGAMLVLDPDTLVVLQAAGDLGTLLGSTLEALLGQPVSLLFRPDQVQTLHTLGGAASLTRPRHLLDPLMRAVADQPLDASLHRSDGVLVLEFEAADLADRFAADPLAGVQEMVRGFDEAASPAALCQLAAESVRSVAQYDRVLVYRFMADGSGWVIAESREPHLDSFMDLHYPAADIPMQARALYVKNWLRLITRVNYDPAPLVPALNPHTGRPLDMSQAILRDVSGVHRQYLRNMGIDASMSISIVRGGVLWGLIACHNYSPRILPRHLRAVCELFGSMFSLQLEARERALEFENRLASRTVLQNLILNVASAEDYAAGLTRQSPNLLDYIHNGRETLDGATRGGVAICVGSKVTVLGTTPSPDQVDSVMAWLRTRMAAVDEVFSTDRLGDLWPEAASFADVASGLLAVSVSPERSDMIVWFGPEMVETGNWAGDPRKLIESGPDGDRLTPRRSFAAWKETVRGRCLPWAQADLEAAADLRLSLLHVVLRRINTVARERRRLAERDQLLMAELDHRVKNTIANIQALVVQTSRSADTLTGFVEGLDGRIQSMGKAHSLLSQSRWEGVSIDRLMREELSHYANGQTGVSLSGRDLKLTPRSALSLSLAVHELATNAAKFGALSRTGGQVAARWALGADGGIKLNWRESNGPTVQPPTRKGFGSTLIERALAMETGGWASIAYDPSGIVCDIHLPPSSVAPSDVDALAPPAERPVFTSGPVRAAQEAFRILVVEDSFLLVMALEMMFDELGWTVVGPATRKADALALARTETLDAAMLDINLDGEMSWDVAGVLKERGIPFVFSTGYDISTMLPDHLAGSQVIGKPFHTADVELRLRQVIAEACRR